MQKATNQEIIDAYKATGSIWRAAKALGLCGQSVWERLRALGYPIASRKWSGVPMAASLGVSVVLD